MLQGVNKVRRRVMRALTGNIGKSSINKKSGRDTMRRILITRPNHRLGNLLLITPLLQEISATFPQCKVDLFVKGGLAPILYKNYSNVDRIISLPKKPFKELFKYLKVWVSLKRYRYDLVISLDSGSSSGRLSTSFVTAKNKIYGEHISELLLKYSDYIHMGKNPVYNFRYYINLLGIKPNTLPVPGLDIKLSDQEISNGRLLLNNIASQDKRTIAIFTYATGNKCYCTTWWSDYYNKLKVTFPHYNIVEILPVENVSQIGFAAPSFYSNDVREIAAVIANTDIFIGADSGIMHLAASTHIPVVGLFSVTSAERYAPYGNNSIALNTNSCNLEKSIEAVNKILNDNKPPTVMSA